MDIRVNGQHVDITLDVEKNLTDVEASMAEWAAKRDLLLTGMAADDEFYIIGEIPPQPLEEISVLDLQIQSPVELMIATLTDGVAYCDRISEYIDHAIEDAAWDMSDVEPFFSGIDWLLDITQSVFRQLDLDINDIKHLDKSVAEYLADITQLSVELREIVAEKDAERIREFLKQQKELFAAFRGIFKMALMSDSLKSMVIKSIDSPDTLVQALYQSREQLPDQLDNLEKISEAFQSGRDNEATELLQQFLDFMHMFTRSAIQTAPVFGIDQGEICVQDVSFDQKITEINDLLSEVVDAMENDDIISASDILEYELRPSLEPVPEYLSAILKRVS